ncbi:MAG: hypothetical protein ACFB4J_12655 [Elainellaceae cyanobacterium]
MPDDARFLIKLLVASAAIAALIKYVGPRLPLPATGPVALTIVLVPVAGTALWMLGQAQR